MVVFTLASAPSVLAGKPRAHSPRTTLKEGALGRWWLCSAAEHPTTPRGRGGGGQSATLRVHRGGGTPERPRTSWGRSLTTTLPRPSTDRRLALSTSKQPGMWPPPDPRSKTAALTPTPLGFVSCACFGRALIAIPLPLFSDLPRCSVPKG